MLCHRAEAKQGHTHASLVSAQAETPQALTEVHGSLLDVALRAGDIALEEQGMGSAEHIVTVHRQIEAFLRERRRSRVISFRQGNPSPEIERVGRPPLIAQLPIGCKARFEQAGCWPDLTLPGRQIS